MTERINVEVKSKLNRAHAVLACVFWIVLGGFGFAYLSNSWTMRKYAWVAIVFGIAFGIIRIFMINNKYAWQVATLEEIEYVQELLESEKEYNKINEVNRNIAEIKQIIKELNSIQPVTPIKESNETQKNTEKKEESVEVDTSYIHVNRNGRNFDMKDGKLYCPKCHSFVASESETMCSRCGISFM